MADTILDPVLTQFQKDLDHLAPEIEGLKDYGRVNLEAEASLADHEVLVADQRRVGLILGATAALEALLTDGYPALPTKLVSASALADLDDQIATMTAARTRFAAESEAVAGTITFGDVSPKKETV